MNCPRYREEMAALCAQDFAQHKLIPEGEGRWYCGRPDRTIYGYRVILSPGAVIVYGDIGAGILLASDRDSLAWLRAALRNEAYPDYLLSKVRASEGPAKSFLPELAHAAIEDLRKGKPTFAQHIAAELNDSEDVETFQRAWFETTGDFDPPDCKDWSPTLLRIYHGLVLFARLLDQGKAQVES